MEFLELMMYSTILRAHDYLEETGRHGSFERFPYLNELAERFLDGPEEDWKKSEGAESGRYRDILKKIGGGSGDDVLKTALNLALTVRHIPEFGAYLNYFTGSKATLQLAYEMEGVFCPDYREAREKMERLGLLFYIDWKNGSILSAELSADYMLFAWLMGDSDIDPVLEGTAEWFLQDGGLHPMFIREAYADQGADYLEREGGILQLSGNGGRRFLAKHIAVRMKRDMLFVEARAFGSLYEDTFERIKMCLLREALLREGILCIYGITAEGLKASGADVTEFYKRAVLPFSAAGLPVLLCTGEEVRFWGSAEREIICIRLTVPDREERERVWQGFAELYGLPVDSERYSVRYRLTPSEIAGAVAGWRHTAEEGNSEMEFSRICYEILSGAQTEKIGNVLIPKVGFSDLILPEHMKKTLGQICCGSMESCRMYETWNLKQQYPYGRAMSVLLCGPPGTGKTMTAHVLAKELGIPLYQVDLSHIMDKYIGETEKHLEQVFAFAEKTNMVLFFDEADSLFGKRGEVTEGKDRYANMEVSYILQRIEQFDGLVVLATNFYHNIDKAFLRRMKYILKYEAPDAALRRSIWKNCLPNELPRERLDLDFLAGQFDFTGGMIKNAVWGACVEALYEKEKLNMSHILSAVKREYEKMERAVSADLWGEYGYLME